MVKNIIEALKLAEELKRKEQALKAERQQISSAFIKENALDDKARAQHLAEAQQMLENGKRLIEEGKAQINLARQVMDFVGYQQEAGLSRSIIHKQIVNGVVTIRQANHKDVTVDVKKALDVNDLKQARALVQNALIASGYDYNSARNVAFKTIAIYEAEKTELAKA